jgi:hypothetical protein
MAENEHGLVLFTIIFISIFILLVSTIPSSFFTHQTGDAGDYVEIDVPDRWDTGFIGSVGVKDYDNQSVVYGNAYFFTLTYIEEDDTEIQLQWGIYGASYNYLYFYHKHMWWIFPDYKHMTPFPVEKDYMLSVEQDNVSAVYIRCETGDIPEILVQIGFDNNTYDSLTEAWNDGHLEMWLGYMQNASATQAYYNVWILIGQLLTFQAPNIHPYLNAIIAIPIWAAIVLSVIYTLDKILPF